MYGLVNAGIEELARSVGGDDAWERIKARAGVDDAAFVGLRAYPDDVTYRLVGAAADVLGLAPDAVLEAFGEHWVCYTARSGWGPLLDAAGDDLPTFLLGLDGMHARVGLTMPALQPPSFTCTDVAAGSLRLHYRSTRDGLAPMVVGLLRGLGVLFGTPVEVEHASARADGADHDEFVVRHGAAVTAPA